MVVLYGGNDDDKKAHISICVAGIIGYLALEYAMHRHLTEKADVFAFGVVALEIAWRLHKNNHDVELLDTSVSEFDEEELIRVIGVSLLCTQASPNMRPLMSRVVAMLTGDIEVGNVTSRSRYLTD